MKIILSLLLAFAATVSASAQSPAKILKQAEKALGGARVLQGVRSTVRTGTVVRSGDGASGNFMFQTAQPNLMHVSFDLGGFEMETGYNGRSAWTRNSRDGLRTLTGKASSDLQAVALFRNSLWLRYRSEKSKIVSAGSAMLDGRKTNVLAMTTRKGVLIKLYFDAATGLPVRDEVPHGDQTEVSDYSDYRMVNGLMQPFINRVSVGGDTLEFRLENVTANGPFARERFDFPTASGQALPDIAALLSQLQENEDRVEALLERYSYVEKSISRELTKDGTLRETGSETYQVSFYKGRRIRRLIEKNGEPLNPRDQQKADKDATDYVEAIDEKVRKDEARVAKGSGPPSEDNRRISIAEVLRSSKLLNPRRERFRSRNVIVFDFEPDPSYDMSRAKSMLKFFGKTAGVIWIDEEDRQVARIEAVLFENYKVGGGVLAKLQKGASFTLEKERVGDEVWLPSQTDVNLSVRVLLVKGITLNQVIKAYDYRRFETEVTDSKVSEPVRP